MRGSSCWVQEWWNTESLPDFLRKWNLVIHEWLKAYVYRPLRSSGVPARVVMLAILMVSAFEHDFLLSAGLGYFMPVYMVEYGFCGKLIYHELFCSAIHNYIERYNRHKVWAKICAGFCQSVCSSLMKFLCLCSTITTFVSLMVCIYT